MVASSHGGEGGQVVADLLARLDVVAWDVCPGHRHIYFITQPFPSFTTRSFIQDYRSPSAPYWCLTSEQTAGADFTEEKSHPVKNHTQCRAAATSATTAFSAGPRTEGYRSIRESRGPQKQSQTARSSSAVYTHTSQWRYSASVSLRCPSANTHAQTPQ